MLQNPWSITNNKGRRTSQLFKGKFGDLTDLCNTWAIYVRTDHRFRCMDCYDVDRGTSRISCSNCYGTGYNVELQRWHIFPTDSIRRAQGAEVPLTSMGWSPEHNFYAFSREHNKPVVGDLFFIVEWDTLQEQVPINGQPVRLVLAATVLYSQLNIANDIIYYVAHCDLLNEGLKELQTNLLTERIRVTK